MKKKAVNISFNSLQEMSDWIEKTPRTERGEIYKASIREGEERRKFSGSETYAEADALLRGGDTDNARKILAASSDVKASGTTNRNRLYNSPCGFMPIVPRVLAGVPENMLAIRKEEYKNTKVLNVIYNTTTGHRVPTDAIIKTSASVASAIKTLEKNGYRVNLHVANFVYMNSTPVYIAVKIKDAGQYFDSLRVAYPLINPSFLRRHIFAVMERIKDVELPGSYGAVMEDYDAARYAPKDTKYLSFYKCRGRSADKIIELVK